MMAATAWGVAFARLRSHPSNLTGSCQRREQPVTGSGSSHAYETCAVILLNGEPEPLSASSVAELLALKGISEQRGIAVALNGAVVRREAWHATRIRAGDRIEIVHARQGG